MIWNFLSTAALFIAVLTIVVFIHELGHFLVARWYGVKVEAFSIGFGPEICGFTDRLGTRWKLAWIPLGGYVKFIDDENAASVPSKEALEKLTPEQREGALQTKPLAHKAAIVVAGPAFNVISAILIYIATFWALGSWGTAAIVDDVLPESAAARAGLRSGDRITAIDGRPITWFGDLQRIVSQSAGQPLAFGYERGGRALTVTITPELREITDPLGNKLSMGAIGIRRDPPAILEKVAPESNAGRAGLRSGDRVVAIDGKPVSFASQLHKHVQESPGTPLNITVDRSGRTATVTVTPEARKLADPACQERPCGYLDVERVGGPGHWVHQSYSFVDALRTGLSETWFVSKQIVTSLPKLPGAIAKVLSGQKQSELGGPIAIAEMTAHASKSGLGGFLGWIAVFSIMLGIMNLLPIPLLDGGHLMFYAIEAVSGRPLDERKQELAFRVGMALLATMMLTALYSDVSRVFSRLFGTG